MSLPFVILLVLLHRYKRRLWYAERAELFHPMFKKVQSKKIADAFGADASFVGAGKAALKQLSDLFNGFSSMRPGGYTCNVCSTRIKPTKIVAVEQVSTPILFSAPEDMLSLLTLRACWG